MQSFKFGFGDAAQEKDEFCDASQPVVSAASQSLLDLGSIRIGEIDAACTLERFSPSEHAAEALQLFKLHIDSTDAAARLGVADVNVSDLVPGNYEGGFKLWEGARDLTQVVCSEWHRAAETEHAQATPDEHALPDNLKGKRVLELGCGHGLPGIATLLAGAAVLFHDLNMSVLSHATAPNVIKNTELQKDLRPYAHFVDGDFQSAAKMISARFGINCCDVILTAESIYNRSSAQQLLEACDMCLTKKGSVLLAAKSYYFGVGGSIASFKKLVEMDGRFKWKLYSRFDDGSNNVREVLLLSRSTVK